MAVVNFSGFETGDTTESPSTTGTFSYSTSTVYDGTYSLRTNPTTTAVGAVRLRRPSAAGNFNNPPTHGTYGYSFMFRYATKPASNSENIYRILDGSDVQAFAIRIDSAGQLSVYDDTDTLVATGSTALSSNTWYRLSGVVTNGAGTGTYTLKIDGVSELSGTAKNFSATALRDSQFGKSVDLNGNTVDFFYDNFVMDGLVEPPAYKIRILLANANGSTMQWTSGTGSSDYQEVDEIPRDDTNYVKNPASGANEVALFDVQSLSDISMSNYTPIAIKGIATIREDVGTTSANRIRIRSGSTNSDSDAFNHSTPPVARTWVLTTDPDTGSAWTEAGVAGIEVGSIENNTVAMRLTFAAVGVLLSDAATTTSTSSTSSSISTSSTSSSISTSSSTSISMSTSSTSSSISTSTSMSTSTTVSHTTSTSSTSSSISTSSTSSSSSTSTSISTSSTSSSVSTSVSTSSTSQSTSTSSSISTSSTSSSTSTSTSSTSESTSTSVSTSSTSSSISTSISASSTSQSTSTSMSTSSTSSSVSTSTSISISTSSTSTSFSTTTTLIAYGFQPLVKGSLRVPKFKLVNTKVRPRYGYK